MKKNIRNSVFETNSSSVHTVSIKGDFDTFSIAFGSKEIVLYLQEYGWSGPPCCGFFQKLSYAMSMVLHTEYPNFNIWDDDFYIDEDILEKLNGYQLLLNTINIYNKNCKKITICRNDDAFYPYGYIDHQSYEDYHCLQDFFDDWNITVERFLFDNNVVVYISNDNI